MSLIDFEKKLAQDIQKSGLLTRSLGDKVAFRDCISHLQKDKVISKLLQDYNCCRNQGKPCLDGSAHPFDWHLFKAIEFAFLVGDDTEEVDKVMARGGNGEDKFFSEERKKYVQKHGYSSSHLFEWHNKYMPVADPNKEKNTRWILNVKLCDGTSKVADTEEEVQTSGQVVVIANVPDYLAVDTEKEQTDSEDEAPIVVATKKRKTLPTNGHTSDTPMWVNRACKLLVNRKIPIYRVAQQVRRVANTEDIDFDKLLELEVERCLDATRITELQNELHL